MGRYQGRRPEDSDYGLGEHTIDCDKLGIIDEKELAERLIKTFESPSYHPPRLPEVATELLALSQQAEVEFDAVQSLLEKDPVLAGEVLSTARSAYYARAVQVDGLHEALVRLGLGKLKDIVFQAAMNLRVFRSAAYSDCMERLQHHCQATAHLSRIVSMHTPLAGERAFLCGLLHDVGIAGVLLVLGDTERGKTPPELSLLWPAIDAVHARAGARMVQLWRLPAEISMAVGAHHQVRIDGQDHPLAAIVCVAESLALELDMGLIPTHVEPGANDLDASGLLVHGHIDRTDEAIVRRARKALELDERALDLIREEARAWAREIAAPAATRGPR